MDNMEEESERERERDHCDLVDERKTDRPPPARLGRALVQLSEAKYQHKHSEAIQEGSK